MYKPVLFFCLLFCSPFWIAAQANADSIPAQEPSRLLRFVETGTTDSERATLTLYVREQDTGEPILGATALLTRTTPEGVYGKVTQWDGRCRFKTSPGTYDIRIQLTGMVTFEKTSVELLAGRQYEMDIDMARLGHPVPSVKQQAGRNEK